MERDSDPCGPVAHAVYSIDRAGELRLDWMYWSTSRTPVTPDGLARCARTGDSPAVQEPVMSLSHHHQRQLHRIGTGLLRSDPRPERTRRGGGAGGRLDPAAQAYG
jgi:hypothetical protein